MHGEMYDCHTSHKCGCAQAHQLQAQFQMMLKNMPLPLPVNECTAPFTLTMYQENYSPQVILMNVPLSLPWPDHVGKCDGRDVVHWVRIEST